MSKKHFKALAEEIARIDNIECRKVAAYAVMNAVRQFNGMFDRDKFLTACGVL